MKPEFYFYCYPWDLEDEGLDVSLGRLAGEIGVDGICVGAVLPEITQLRTMEPNVGRIFRSKASVHFQPDSKLYSGTRIRPQPASWMKARNPLERIVHAAEKNRIRVRASVAPLQGAALCERNAHAVRVTAFRDQAVSGLCPSNPDVREYVASLIEDLSSNYELCGIELTESAFEIIPGEDVGDISFFLEYHNDPVSSLLHRWCFCASCRQRMADSGVDAQQVSAIITERVKRIMREGATDDLDGDSLCRAHPELEACQRVRFDTITSLIKAVRGRTKKQFICRLFREAEELNAADPVRIAAFCDRIIAPMFAEHLPMNEGLAAAGLDSTLIELRYSVHNPGVQNAPDLVSGIHKAAQSGYAAIDLATYGEVAVPTLDWVRQAIRYARREAT